MDRLQQLYVRLIAGASLDELRYLCAEPAPPIRRGRPACLAPA